MWNSVLAWSRGVWEVKALGSSGQRREGLTTSKALLCKICIDCLRNCASVVRPPPQGLCLFSCVNAWVHFLAITKCNGRPGQLSWCPIITVIDAILWLLWCLPHPVPHWDSLADLIKVIWVQTAFQWVILKVIDMTTTEHQEFTWSENLKLLVPLPI